MVVDAINGGTSITKKDSPQREAVNDGKLVFACKVNAMQPKRFFIPHAALTLTVCLSVIPRGPSQGRCPTLSYLGAELASHHELRRTKDEGRDAPKCIQHD